MLERSLELALALEHLHHHMADTFVVHRDLKPDNVGFKADGTLKLVSEACVSGHSSREKQLHWASATPCVPAVGVYWL